MILTINKPKPTYVRWCDIKPGDVFSWGSQAVWYVKVSPEAFVELGSGQGLLPGANVEDCGTLVVAARVEVTP